MDANGIAFIISVVIMGILGVYKNYPKFMARFNGSIDVEAAKQEKPTIENLNARIGELEQKVTAERERADKAHEKTGQVEAQFDDELKKLQKRIDDLEAQLQKSLDETKAQTEGRIKAENDYKAVLEKYVTSQDTVISMTKELDEYEKTIQGLKVEMSAMQKVGDIVTSLSKSISEAVIAGMKEALSTGELAKILTKDSAA